MDHSVPLARLPEGLQFPPAFADRIYFDDNRRRLVFRGFMCKAEFDQLCQLSKDWSYRRPLEELFRLCTPQEHTPARGLRRVLGILSGKL